MEAKGKQKLLHLQVGTYSDLVGLRVTLASGIRWLENELQQVIVMNAETGDIYGLDESAAIAWKALMQSGSVNAAVDALVEAYHIEPEVATNDIAMFVSELLDNNLVAPFIK
ncbi:hypothetical protein Tter_1155 [Thermobaculum terrenum ATCC BAA-798]|uniref:Coenzyme PQQ synthesis D n=1 Tax=Thermobaculum terrenum (strain ATCC BAA-798 / CCMEE 7001 / YNP1) TaxID=525904 RepID=D1CB99_THET1|nr:PqqD family protein [Thermobaculum terrenum]ACZ42064.1 hypothetical protein Tter_1155 [Thermobaculum terrenum ATCC BAA-798]